MKLRTILTSAMAATALAAIPAPAGAHQADWSAAKQSEWQKMSSSRVSAETILRGDINGGTGEIATVDDLILSPTGNQVQYVLFELRQPLTNLDTEDAFVAWDNVDVSNAEYGEAEVRIVDTADAQAPEELTLTERQANRRLVSELIGADMTFADGQVREVEDILFDPKTGIVRDYVVDFDQETVFDLDQRRVPASLVSIDANGGLRTAQPLTWSYEVWIL